MERREKSHYKNKLVTDSGSTECEKALSRFIKDGENEKASDLLDLIKNYNRKDILVKYRENEDETFLHTAVKYQDDSSMVEHLVRLCPQLLTQARENSENYKGQTAFHIAITKGNTDAVEAMLRNAKDGLTSDILKRMMYTEATGARFVNTVMMGGIALSVAALAFYPEIVQILIENDAEIEFTNEEGDTVFHSLIKYAAIYPEKISDVVSMLGYLQGELEEKGATERILSEESNSLQYKYQYTYVWFIRNNDHLTPLQLAAKHGVVEAFNFIVNLEDVYCFFSTHDGLFDIKMYDVTEVDSIATIKANASNNVSLKKAHGRGSVLPKREGIASRQLRKSKQQTVSCGGIYPETESVLEMVFSYSYHSKDAFRLTEMPPFKNLVRAKWTFYRWIYYFWFFVHVLFIIGLTGYAVVRPHIIYNTTGKTRTERELEHPDVNSFIRTYQWLSFVVGLMYGVVSILLFVPKFRRSNSSQYFLHNLAYIALLTVHSSCIIIDALMTASDDSHDSIPLIIALITGWWFTIFFLRPLRIFSFFTEMIKRVIFGDLLRFGIVLLFELISFTAAMHILFQVDDDPTSNDDGAETEYSTYWYTMLAMFKLMLGLGDIESLYDSRVPWLSVTLFVIFVIISYVLLLNALIAMMSQTCAIVLEDRYPQWRLQQLSVMLFLEDIFCLCCLTNVLPCHAEAREIRGFDTATKQNKSDIRYLFEIHSLQMTYATEEEKTGVMKTRVQPTIHNSMGTIQNMTSQYDLNATTVYRDDFSFNPLSPRRREGTMTMMRRPSSRSRSYRDTLSPIKPPRRDLHVLKEEDSEIDTPPPRRRKGDTFEDFPDVEPSQSSPILLKKQRSKRKKHKSENLHEKKPPSPTMVHPGSNGSMYASAPEGLPAVGDRREVDIQTVHSSHS